MEMMLRFSPRLRMSSYKAGVASDLDETTPSDLVTRHNNPHRRSGCFEEDNQLELELVATET